jgi:hypothetical protein
VARWPLTFSTINWQIALFTFDVSAMRAWLADSWSWAQSAERATQDNHITHYFDKLEQHTVVDIVAGTL